MKRLLAVIAVAAGVVLWVGVSAQQEMLPRPGPGSGITTVIGAVSISNTPDVRVVDMPPVVIASPSFVRKGRRYAITWTGGEQETISVVEPGGDGWVLVEGTRRRWVNLRAARSVEEGR